MKQIILKATMEGSGIVNFDDNSQRFTLSKLGIGDLVARDSNGKPTENVKYAKKHFFKKKDKDGNDILDKDGNPMYDYSIKISADCLRNAIFKNEVEYLNPIILKNEVITCNYYLSKVGLTRGYMNTNRDESGYKNKTCITVTDAKEISGAKSALEIGTTSGERNLTSMFYTEKVGDTKYAFKGVIDPKTLMFVVADPMFDRMGLNPDWITNGLAEKILHNLYGDISHPSVGYFTASSGCLTQTISEFGMILNEDLVKYLIKFLLKSIMTTSIKRNNAYARVDSLSIKFVDDILDNDNDEGWINLKTLDDVDNLDFEVECPYEKSSEEDVKRLDAMKEKYKEAVALAKEEKKKVKAEQAEKRNNKKETAE